MARQLIASNQTRGFRRVTTVTINQDNQQATIDLPRGPHIEAVELRIGGTINHSVAWTAARNSAPYLFLRRADWVLNSNVTMDSLSGSQLLQHQFTRRGLPASTTPAFALGATSFEASYFLDRVMIDGMRPKDSYLKTDVGVSNNQLRLQFGAIGDMFTGAGTSTYTSVTASVHVYDYQEARDASGNTPTPLYYLKRNGYQQSISAAGNGQQIKVNTGNRLRYISVRVLNATTREPDASLVTAFKLQRAGDTRVDINATDLQRLNQASYGVAMPTGQYVIDLANIGALGGVLYSEFWPVPSSADTYLYVDTTAACILDITTLEGVDMVR
jgi:hypothetical protein